MPHPNQMNRLRVFHALLGISVIAAYFSTEWGRNHSIIGYVVAALIIVRIIMFLSGAPQLGLMRFYPHFEDLRLDHFMTQPAISKTLLLLIAVSLLTVTGTGLVMDNGRTINRVYLTAIGKPPPPRHKKVEAVPILAVGDGVEADRREKRENDEDEDESIIEEIHETAGNMLMLLVIAHVCYLILFKRPLAKFMLYIPPKKRESDDGG